MNEAEMIAKYLNTQHTSKSTGNTWKVIACDAERGMVCVRRVKSFDTVDTCDGPYWWWVESLGK